MPAAFRHAPVALALALLAAAPARAQEGTADSTAADSVAAVADTTAVADPATAAVADSAAAAADSLAAASEDVGEPAPEVPHVVPSLEGLTKVGISFRDMVAATPGDDTQVEIWRGASGQVLRFVTGGTTWAWVVRPPGGRDPYTLRDHDCSGAFEEELQAGTPLAVPDCAAGGGSAAPAAPAASDD